MADTAIRPNWSFLTNHTHLLVVLNREPAARIRDLAEEVGITQRAVQRILAELVSDRILSIKKEGRRNVYRIRRAARLRHPLEHKHTIGEILNLIG